LLSKGPGLVDPGLLLTFGSAQLPRIYLPKLFGKWPQASRACSFGGNKWPIWAPRRILAAFGTPISGLIPIFQTVSPRTPVNNREAGPGLLRPHPRFLSASRTPAVTAAAQLAHLFFESLHAFGQPVEALVDLLPVSFFVLASRVRASLLVPAAPGPGSASLAPTLRAAPVAPAPTSAHGCTLRSVFVRLAGGLFTPRGLKRNRCHRYPLPNACLLRSTLLPRPSFREARLHELGRTRVRSRAETFGPRPGAPGAQATLPKMMTSLSRSQ
jgi:hypothetical protein